MRVRGLKLAYRTLSYRRHPSHPMRVRGLKHYFHAVADWSDQSHPMRVRGLKHVTIQKKEKCNSRTPCGCVD